jgi:putative ABC transport system substrate-binding protein
VGSGLVTSLGRPGGNVTGLSLFAPAVVGKRLELLKEVVPKVNRVAVLTNPGHPGRALVLTQAAAAMRPLGLHLQVPDARGPGECCRYCCCGRSR